MRAVVQRRGHEELSSDRSIPEMLHIRGGEAVFGCDTGRPDERPARMVALPDFQAARRPITNAEYLAFVQATGHQLPGFIEDERFSGPEQPVVGVSWHDANAYCAWLRSVTGLAFRLPSEAEREYAARGGLAGADWPWGEEPPDQCAELMDIARLERPHVPGPVCCNGFGLMCMADNVHEWCQDWYVAGPGAPPSAKRKSSRGGSWRHAIKFTRVSARSSIPPEYQYNDYGFRVYI